MMRRLCPFVLFVFAGLPLWAGIEVLTDHADAMYRCGEKAAFTVTVTDGAALMKTGEVSIVLDNFGTNVLLRKTFRLAETNRIVIAGTRGDPGFLRLTVKGAGGNKVWGVGYEPDGIRPVTPVPDDFDAFWSDARKKLAAEIPLDAQVTKVPERCTDRFDFYRISFATFGRRVHGYMSVPADKARAPFAVKFQVSAAGFGDWTNNMDGSPDRINVFFSVYPFEPHWKWKELGLEKSYKAMDAAFEAKYGCSRYCVAGAGVSREDYFYYPVILGIDRAIDWLAARGDVDPARIAYEGTSQGGGMGLALTGLNKHISRAVFFVPAITDTLAGGAGQQSGWPAPVEGQKSAEARAIARRVMPYFDGASFATRITCPVRMAVGLADTTCAPHCTWATYNALASKDKRLFYGIGMGHGCRVEFYQAFYHWLLNVPPREPLAVTFTYDDNNRDFVSIVLPLMGKYGWKGIFNVVTDNVAQGGPGFSWNDVRALYGAGHEIASHSASHPNLVTLLGKGNTNEVMRQICESRDVLARELGRRPNWFCYPGNSANAALRQLVDDAGMRSEACHRPNFGYECPDRTEKGAYIRLLRNAAAGSRHTDIMIHGVRKGRGWKPFDDAMRFEAHLQEVKALEDEGFIRVMPYSEAYKADEPK